MSEDRGFRLHTVLSEVYVRFSNTVGIKIVCFIYKKGALWSISNVDKICCRKNKVK